ncbi:serum response factor-binding protein 1 [Ambystoma mexicanum]|uniref:serum response factor-binding protein 1 n=1 Tax=Ambystoma mexicanum TaxID=8296 RepID=UPI0037E92D5E
MAPVLNLNNEVVKMRKEVKKIRVLTIRKLTRHLSKLKSKKGTEEDLLRNQRRVQRLLEEIHAMKDLKPDEVTKTALQTEINFEEVCKKEGSNAPERAIARLATHPQFKKKIVDIKAAVQAFKDERMNPSASVQTSGDCHSKKNLELGEKAVLDEKGKDAIGKNEIANSTNDKVICGRDGKKNNGVKCMKPALTEIVCNPDVPSQIEIENTLVAPKENIVTDFTEILPVPPRENAIASPKGSRPAAPTEEKPASPKENEPTPLKQAMTALQKVDTPAVSTEAKSASVTEFLPGVPKPPVPAAFQNDTPASPKANVPVFTEEETAQKEGQSLVLKENIPAVKEDSSDTTKQEDSSYVKHNEMKGIQKGLDSDESESEKRDKKTNREYFDDSTEERFHKKSSGPDLDDDDSEDDFFIGKVKRRKKRKGNATLSAAKDLPKASVKASIPISITDVGSDTRKPNSKAPKLESVFCQSLAQSKVKPALLKRHFKDQQLTNKKGAFPQHKPQDIKQLHSSGLAAKQDNRKHPSVKQDNRKQQLQQPIHPSWEASKKRKEQQSLITVFQGKKIKFDD